MRTTNKLLLAALAVAGPLLFAQCTKGDCNKIFHANFYTTSQTGNMYLYIDGVNKGQLAWLTNVSPCGDVSGEAAARPVSLELQSGDYRVVGKDDQGNIVSSSIMSIRKDRKSVSGNIGGLNLVSNDDCLSVGLSQ